MSLTLKQQIESIHATAREQGKPDEFAAQAVIFWLEWHLNFSLAGNGFLDNDEATLAAVSSDKDRISQFKAFLASAGIRGWYNKDLS